MLQPDIEGPFEGGEKGVLFLDRVNDGAKWLIEKGYADPDRLCIMGGARGGFAALQVPTRHREVYKCAIAYSPTSTTAVSVTPQEDPLEFENAGSYDGKKGISAAGMPPHVNAQKMNTPLLLIHGEEDWEVAFEESRSLANDLKEVSKDITFLKFEDGDHYLSRQEHRTEFLKAVEKFLARHLN